MADAHMPDVLGDESCCLLHPVFTHAYTHTPAPPKRLITYALYLLSKIFPFPSFVSFPNPLLSLALPAAWAVPAGEGTLCSH